MSLQISGDVAVLVTYNMIASYPGQKQKTSDLDLKTIEAAYNTKQKQVMRTATLLSCSAQIRKRAYQPKSDSY